MTRSHLYRNMAITVAFGVVTAFGLYYLFSREKKAIKKGRTAKEMKDLGNRLFAVKNYEDSIRVFSEAITSDDSGENPPLKAMCFQNRAAAKEHHGGFTVDDMLSDCQEAIRYHPRYAKAYFRKARLLEMKRNYKEALVCIFCATQLDPSFDNQSGQILKSVLEHLEKDAYDKWYADHLSRQEPKHVRHEKVYVWLKKTVTCDCIRKDVLSGHSGNGPYADALQMIRDKDYDRVADVAVQEEGANKLKALILAARFYFYRNQMDEFSSCVSKFDALYEALTDDSKKTKKDLLDARHIACIESGRTSEEIMKAFNAALEKTESESSDFYVMAGFRLVLCNDIRTAKKILSTDGKQTVNIKLLYLTLQILCSTSEAGSTDMAQLHNHILELEKFVSELEPKSAYAFSLLAKITATFSTDSSAQRLFDDVFKLEPTESIHFFDRSCTTASGEDAIHHLKKCVALEPYHAEAHLMLASLMMNEIGTRAISPEECNKIETHLSAAQSTFADNVDFPVIMGVFRLREVVEGRMKTAAVLAS